MIKRSEELKHIRLSIRVYRVKVEESTEEEFSRSQVILHKDNKPEILHSQTFDKNGFFSIEETSENDFFYRINDRKLFFLKNKHQEMFF